MGLCTAISLFNLKLDGNFGISFIFVFTFSFQGNCPVAGHLAAAVKVTMGATAAWIQTSGSQACL